MVKKTYKIIVHFSTGENTVVAVSRYKGYAELLAKWIDDYYRLKDMKVIVTVSCKRWDSTADWKRSSKQTRDLFFWSTY